MKPFQVLAAAVLTLSAFTVACSGGGRPRIGGRVCPENYKPIKMVLDAKRSKTSKKLEINEDLPSGTYRYLGAAMHYISPKGFVVFLKDSKLEGEAEFKGRLDCLRDPQEKEEGMAVSAPGISSLEITQAGATIGLKDYGFSVQNTRIKSKVNDNPGKPASLETAYDAVTEKFIVAKPKDVYEIRSHQLLPDGGEYFLMVRFKRSDLKPTPHSIEHEYDRR